MIGYVGLGNMGGALARRLALSNDLLVFDLGEEACARLAEAGAEVAASAADVARRCELVFLCLPTSQHVEAVLFGSGGMAEAAAPGTVFVDQTSGDAHITRRLAQKLGDMGITMIDAPVSGGPQGAEAGTIALMVGASDEAFEKVRPVMESVSPNIFHVGDTGAGNVAKLANNLLSGGIRLMTLEAVTLAVKNGLTPEMAVKVFTASGGNNYWLQKYGQSLLVEGKLGSTFTLGLIHKDVRLACQMGQDSGMPMFFGNQARAFYQMALNAHDDVTAVNTIAWTMEEVCGADYLPKSGDKA